MTSPSPLTTQLLLCVIDGACGVLRNCWGVCVLLLLGPTFFLRNLGWPPCRGPPVVTRRRASSALSTYLMNVSVAKQAEGHYTVLQQQQDLPRGLRFLALHQDSNLSAVKWHIKERSLQELQARGDSAHSSHHVRQSISLGVCGPFDSPTSPQLPAVLVVFLSLLTHRVSY